MFKIINFCITNHILQIFSAGGNRIKGSRNITKSTNYEQENVTKILKLIKKFLGQRAYGAIFFKKVKYVLRLTLSANHTWTKGDCSP
jgi:hypothetical protein